MSIECIPLVSFPKSGNTWLRFILANLLSDDATTPISYRNIDQFSPNVSDFLHNDPTSYESRLSPGSPVFVKSHSSEPFQLPYPFTQAVYLYRNGFDVLYSYWHFIRAQKPERYGSLEHFARCYWEYCGTWGSHIENWVTASVRRNLSVLMVSYEDLKREPLSVVRDIARFARVDVPDDRISDALSKSSVDSMRSMDGGAEFMKSKDPSFNFVRSGRVAEGAGKLTGSLRNQFLKDHYTRHWMREFGYVSAKNVTCLGRPVSVPTTLTRTRCLISKVFSKIRGMALRHREGGGS